MGSVDIALLGIIVVVAVIGLGWLMKEMNSQCLGIVSRETFVGAVATAPLIIFLLF